MKYIVGGILFSLFCFSGVFATGVVLPDNLPIPEARPEEDEGGEGILGGGGSGCNYDGTGDIGAALAGCIQGSDVVYSGGEFTVEGNFKTKINTWTRTLAGILGLLAVGSIVYGALIMTLSAGEDERIKKGKDIVKWSIFGFLGVVAAGGLISILVNFIFAIA